MLNDYYVFLFKVHAYFKILFSHFTYFVKKFIGIMEFFIQIFEKKYGKMLNLTTLMTKYLKLTKKEKFLIIHVNPHKRCFCYLAIFLQKMNFLDILP